MIVRIRRFFKSVLNFGYRRGEPATSVAGFQRSAEFFKSVLNFGYRRGRPATSLAGFKRSAEFFKGVLNFGYRRGRLSTQFSATSKTFSRPASLFSKRANDVAVCPKLRSIGDNGVAA